MYQSMKWYRSGVRHSGSGFVVPAAAPPAGFTVLVSAATGLGGNGGTTASYDTTGANLIILSASWYPGTTADVTVSDSKGNTYTGLTVQTTATLVKCRLYYAYAPTVGTGHTFTLGGASTFSGIGVIAVSGAEASPFDVENGGVSASVSTFSPGVITPSEDNEIVVTAICTDATSSKTLGSGFTYFDIPWTASNYQGGGIGYKIQGAAGAVNPAYSWTTNSVSAAVIASFKAA